MVSTTFLTSSSVSMMHVLQSITSNVPLITSAFQEELTVTVKSTAKTVPTSQTVNVILINFIVLMLTVSHGKTNFVMASKTVSLAKTRLIASQTVYIQSFVTAYAFQLVKFAIKNLIAQAVRTSSTVRIQHLLRIVKAALNFIARTRAFHPPGVAMEMLIVTTVLTNKTVLNAPRIHLIVTMEHAFSTLLHAMELLTVKMGLMRAKKFASYRSPNLVLVFNVPIWFV